MAARSALHKLIYESFVSAFGEPDSSLGRDDHWALKPGASAAAINVLVNGNAERPAVWVFDPHSRHDAVHRASIKTEDDVHKVIKHIEHRLERARALQKT